MCVVVSYVCSVCSLTLAFNHVEHRFIQQKGLQSNSSHSTPTGPGRRGSRAPDSNAMKIGRRCVREWEEDRAVWEVEKRETRLKICTRIWSTMYNLFKFKQWTLANICVWQIKFSAQQQAYWRWSLLCTYACFSAFFSGWMWTPREWEGEMNVLLVLVCNSICSRLILSYSKISIECCENDFTFKMLH